MSLIDGRLAVNLEMPKRVPRFEPSAAEYHWDLVAAVTGLSVAQDSSEESQLQARQAFLILTFGAREQIRGEVERCMTTGKKYPGYFMCVSGHIPPNVPVENALYYNEVYEELRRR